MKTTKQQTSLREKLNLKPEPSNMELLKTLVDAAAKLSLREGAAPLFKKIDARPIRAMLEAETRNRPVLAVLQLEGAWTNLYCSIEPLPAGNQPVQIRIHSTTSLELVIKVLQTAIEKLKKDGEEMLLQAAWRSNQIHDEVFDDEGMTGADVDH